MAKKQKNQQHAESLRRKEIAAQEMAKLGMHLGDDLSATGFVFTHLSMSHLTYLGLISINKLCKTYAGIDICLFSQHISQPCVPPLCPVFGEADLTRWRDSPLITTNIETTLAAMASNAKTIYHYAFDPEFIDQHHIESSCLRTAFCDPRVRVITRHESHRKLIEAEFDIEVCDLIVQDCDAEELVRLVLTETKNDN